MPDRMYNVLFLCTGNSARSAFRYLKNRIGTFASLPVDSIEVFKGPPLDNMDKHVLAAKLRDIGSLPGTTDLEPKTS